MKRIIGLSLLLVSIAAGCKRETNVVEYPAVDFYTTETLDVNRIELTDSTTVLHFSAVYIPKFWIRLDKGTHILMPVSSHTGMMASRKYFMFLRNCSLSIPL